MAFAGTTTKGPNVLFTVPLTILQSLVVPHEPISETTPEEMLEVLAIVRLVMA